MTAALIWKDRVQQTVSAVTSAGLGAFTLSSATSSFQALGAPEDTKQGFFFAFEGTSWETFWGTYTHSGTSLARTARLASSTGSAITFTSAAVVTHDLAAQASMVGFSASQASMHGHRLTLSTGIPVTPSDVTGATAVYSAPYMNDRIGLHDGNIWLPTQVPEFAGALGTKTASIGYDVFDFRAVLTPSSTNTSTDIVTFGSPHGLLTGAYCTSSDTVGGLSVGVDYWLNCPTSTTVSFHPSLAKALGGTFKVDLTANITQALVCVSEEHVAWTNGTTRATGLSMQDGRNCKSGDTTRLHVGSFYTSSTTTTEDSAGGTTSQVGGQRFLWNRYNRVTRFLAVKDTTSAWVNQTSSWRQTNGNAGNKVEFFLGDQDVAVTASHFGTIAMNNFTTNRAAIGLGLDSTTVPSGFSQGGYTAVAAGIYIISACAASYSGTPGAGYHYLAGLEYGAAGSTDCQFTGLDADSGQCGLSAAVWM